MKRRVEWGLQDLSLPRLITPHFQGHIVQVPPFHPTILRNLKMRMPALPKAMVGTVLTGARLPWEVYAGELVSSLESPLILCLRQSVYR